jgi:hypothetical protein
MSLDDLYDSKILYISSAERKRGIMILFLFFSLYFFFFYFTLQEFRQPHYPFPYPLLRQHRIFIYIYTPLYPSLPKLFPYIVRAKYLRGHSDTLCEIMLSYLEWNWQYSEEISAKSNQLMEAIQKKDSMVEFQRPTAFAAIGAATSPTSLVPFKSWIFRRAGAG